MSDYVFGTNTQRAKQLYRDLRESGRLPTLWFTGLLDGDIWVTRHDKAYKLENISTSHLENIIAHAQASKYEIPPEIHNEYARRHQEVQIPPIDFSTMTGGGYMSRPPFWRPFKRRWFDKIMKASKNE